MLKKKMGLPSTAAVLIFIFTITNNAIATSIDLNSNYVSREPRMANDTLIPISAAPYMVSIHLKYIDLADGFGAGAVCGGAVISQRMIITAARFLLDIASEVLPADDFTVVMGTIYTNKKDQYTLEYDVQKLVPYPKYNQTTLYDIAAVFINGYIPWNWPTVKALQLNSKEMPIGMNCIVTGWQMQLLSTNATALMSVAVPIMNITECNAITGFDISSSSMLCAGYSNFSGVDACKGESGDPLVCGGYLTGLVSVENGCTSNNYPGYYGNVSDFYSWIIQTNASFDYNSYSGANGIYACANIMVFISIFVALILHY